MKLLHKNNLFCWSQFDEDRNIDFHSYLWLRDEGNVVFDPLPLTAHDEQHLKTLGGVRYIIISNSDHIRYAEKLAKQYNAEIWGPAGEKSDFPIACTQWLTDAKNVIEGLDVYTLAGSKTQGELAFIIEGHTLITGDLIRAHAADKLCLLPDGKLTDIELAKASVKNLAAGKNIQAVLPGDGWPIFSHGTEALEALIATF